MSDNIQTNTTGRLTPCLQKRIDKTTYLVEVHFSATSTQRRGQVKACHSPRLRSWEKGKIKKK